MTSLPKTFDLETIFSEWYSIKKKKSELEDREEEIKKIIHKILTKEKVEELESENFKVSRKSQTRRSVTKSDLPSDIYDKYSKSKKISILYLKRI